MRIILKFFIALVPNKSLRHKLRAKLLKAPRNIRLVEKCVRLLEGIARDVAKLREIEYMETLGEGVPPRHHFMKEAQAEAVDYIKKHAPDALLFKTLEECLDLGVRTARESGLAKGGLFMEFGVDWAYSLNRIARAVPGNTVYGFDSFEGFPADWTGYGVLKGTYDHKGAPLPVVEKNVVLVKGFFDKTLPDFVNGHKEPVAFLHVDCDLYSSAKAVLDAFERQIVPGTVIVFDEYLNYHGWREHEYRVFQEFVKKRKVEYEYLAFGYYNAAVRILSVGK